MTQPNRDDLMYWAEGLTQTFLDGTLMRAMPDDITPTRPARPFDEGAADR